MILQRWDTPSIDLLYITGHTLPLAGNYVVPFRFAAPGPRVRLTLKLLVRQFVDPGSDPTLLRTPPFDWTQIGVSSWNLWLARTVIDTAGGGQRFPVQNLLGTRATPVQISETFGTPLSTNGFSFDVEAGGDGVDGELSFITGGAETDCAIMAAIRGRYNAVQELCDEEWSYLRGKFGGFPDAQRRTLP